MGPLHVAHRLIYLFCYISDVVLPGAVSSDKHSLIRRILDLLRSHLTHWSVWPPFCFTIIYAGQTLGEVALFFIGALANGKLRIATRMNTINCGFIKNVLLSPYHGRGMKASGLTSEHGKCLHKMSFGWIKSCFGNVYTSEIGEGCVRALNWSNHSWRSFIFRAFPSFSIFSCIIGGFESCLALIPIPH